MSRLTSRSVEWTLVIAVFLAGCATASQPPVFIVPSAAPPGQTEYAVQAGDTLAIKFYYHPDHDQEVVVGTDGKAVLPLIGEITAAGLTPARLADEIARRYSSNLRDPKVSVSVKTMSTMSENRVYVGGEVPRPGFVQYRHGLTALKAVIEAGGPKDTARMQEVVLLQKNGPEGQYSASKIDLAKALGGGDTSADLVLAPSDIIFVPKTTVAKLNVFVDQYIVKMLPFRLGPPGL